MNPIFYTQNKVIDSLPLDDRSIHYGDGLFETIAIIQNEPLYFSEHLNRLKEDALHLKFPCINLQTIAEEINFILNQNPQTKAVLKILLTRGSGGRGYTLPFNVAPRLIYGLYPWPQHYSAWQKHGINAYLCRTKVSEQEDLGGIKHLNRLPQILARAEFSSEEFQEGFMLDSADSLICGTMSNIFIVVKGQLFTPVISNAGIRGIMRMQVIKQAKKFGISFEEKLLQIKDIQQADEVFICNSLMGIVPVVSLKELSWAIGSFTQQLMKEMEFKC